MGSFLGKWNSFIFVTPERDRVERQVVDQVTDEQNQILVLCYRYACFSAQILGLGLNRSAYRVAFGTFYIFLSQNIRNGNTTSKSRMVASIFFV